MNQRLFPTISHILSRRCHKSKHKRSIYLIHCAGFYKIGYSKKVSLRVKQYKTHCPIQIDVIATFETKKYRAFEIDVFNMYISKLKHGEWFALSNGDVNNILIKWFGNKFNGYATVQNTPKGGEEIIVNPLPNPPTILKLVSNTQQLDTNSDSKDSS